MAYLFLPVSSTSPAYTFQSDLEGVTYTFGFYYNARTDLWTMDIMDVDENPLIMGVSLLMNVLLANDSQAGGPPGSLYLYDSQGTGDDPHLADLGVRHQVVYRESTTVDV